MAMAEKANVGQNWGEGKEKGQKQQKVGSLGQSGQGQNLKGNKKANLGKEGLGECSPRKRKFYY